MKKQRDRSIDMFKVILVTGMILCHCIMLLKVYGLKSYIVSEYFNVVTFSGFLFCFGYATGIAYLSKSRRVVTPKLVKNCVRTLIAFYISGLGYELLINNDFSFNTIFNTLILNHMPGYSEFLAGFFALNLMILIFFNQFKRLLTSRYLIVLVLMISLIATQIPYDKVPSVQLGLIFGSTKFGSFPILQYFGYYLLGAYFQQNKIKFNAKYIFIAILCSLIFLQYVFAHHIPPLRFPPSLRWIIGGAGILYGYYGLSIWLSRKLKNNSFIYLIGEKTLWFLVLSNLLIFTFRRIYPSLVNAQTCILIAIAILISCYLLVSFINYVKSRPHNLFQ